MLAPSMFDYVPDDLWSYVHLICILSILSGSVVFKVECIRIKMNLRPSWEEGFV